MKLFNCQHCGQLLYFENRKCEQCQHQLGFVPALGTLSALDQEGDTWRALALPIARYRFCGNAVHGTCNWLVPAESAENLCAACRHNRTIPDITVHQNLARWSRFESAKHRLFYTLMRLGVPLPDRTEDPERGLAFDFLAEAPDADKGEKVMTGHADGLITLNLAEADDAEREKLRVSLGETYRTLLGHLRHESGHYFWDRLVRDADRLEPFRELFGDENQDYQTSLETHYAGGPKQNWQQSYISAYASAHPWEDFAESWAHYLHIVDTLEMAFAFGVHIQPGIDRNNGPSVKVDFDPHQADSIDSLIEAWLPLTFAMNALIRCMGEPDFYPFFLSPEVIGKLGFVHELVHPENRAMAAQTTAN